MHALAHSTLLCSTGADKRRRDVQVSDRLRSVLAALSEADDENWRMVLEPIAGTDDLTEEEVRTLAYAFNRSGLKPLVNWFLDTYPTRYLPESDWHRNATRMWWMARSAVPDKPALNFKREADGHVVVDLWHTRRGLRGPASFKDFARANPTFFFGSRGQVSYAADSLQEYVDEAEDCEDGHLYVKRGRFHLNPLLWFDDKNVAELRKDASKSAVVAALVQSHAYFASNQPDFDFEAEGDKTWKKMLYFRTQRMGGAKLALELRLDNNCVEDASVPLAAGFDATLAVDVSGFAGAMMPPGSATPETESVVVWDVPGALVQEWPWERLEV